MSISLSGLGSFDWQSLVEQLNEAEVEQKVTPLTTQKQTQQDKFTAWESLGSLLATLKTAADDLKDASDFDLYKTTLRASSSTATAESILTAETDTDASKGNYDIVINQLARGQRLGADQTFTKDFTFGENAGTFNISTTSGSGEVDLSGKTLTQIKNEINSLNSGDNPTSVTASIVQVSGGSSPQYKLLLSSDNTGETEGKIDCAISGGPADSSDSSYLSFTSTQNAQDATLYLNGDTTTPITRSSNTIDDLTPGVTLTLNKADPDTTVNIDVDKDTEAITDKVQKFVDAYNSVLNSINKQSSYDQTTGTTGGVLYGDSTMKSIKSMIQNAVLGSRSDSGTVLSSIGITFASDNTLSFDTDKFEDALQNDPSDTISALNSFGQLMSTGLNSYTDSIDGSLTSLKKSLQSSMDSLDKRAAAAQDRIDRHIASLTKQFIAMDTAVSNMQSQYSYVASVLGL